MRLRRERRELFVQSARVVLHVPAPPVPRLVRLRERQEEAEARRARRQRLELVAVDRVLLVAHAEEEPRGRRVRSPLGALKHRAERRDPGARRHEERGAGRVARA